MASHSTASGICCPGWSKPSCYGEQGICTNKMEEKRSRQIRMYELTSYKNGAPPRNVTRDPDPAYSRHRMETRLWAAGSGKREIT